MVCRMVGGGDGEDLVGEVDGLRMVWGGDGEDLRIVRGGDDGERRDMVDKGGGVTDMASLDE